MSASDSRAEIVISAVDKATATINQITARLEAATLPARRISEAFGKLYNATGLGGVTSALGNVTNSVGKLAAVSAGIGGAYLGAIGGLLAFGKHAADAVDKIGDLSARYQVHAHTIQVYGGLVEEAGGSTEDAAAGIGKLRKAMNEAVHGGAEQAAAFAGVGISLDALRKMTPEQVMQKMADAFKNSNKEGEKNAVLLTLMGKSGNIFMDVMNKGSDAYLQRLKEMREDGALLSQEQLEQADAFDKSWSRLRRTFDGVKNTLGLGLANALQPMIEKLQQWITKNRDLISQKFDKFLEKLPAILETAGKVFKVLGKAVSIVASAFETVYEKLGPTGSALLGIGILLAPIIAAVLQLGLAFGKVIWVMSNLVTRMNPIGLLVTAIAAASYLIYENWDGIVAYFGQVWERIKSIFEINFFGRVFQVMLDTLQTFANAILSIIKTLTPDALLPDSVKNLKFTFATDYANKVQAQVAQAPQQNIKNTVAIKIDAEGRPRVKELTAGSSNTTLDVSAGLNMVGSW